MDVSVTLLGYCDERHPNSKRAEAGGTLLGVLVTHFGTPCPVLSLPISLWRVTRHF